MNKFFIYFFWGLGCGAVSLLVMLESGWIFNETSRNKSCNFYDVAENEHRSSGMAAGFGEDILIWNIFFAQGNHESPIFLELGALDGIGGSNTYYFERVRGWSGFLVEPFPNECKKLNKNRPKSICLCPRAVCSSGNSIHYYLGGQNGGSLETASEDTLNSLLHCKGEKCLQRPDLMKVPCAKLGDLLKEANGGLPLKTIHFWSLDCEGCEDVALETFDWQSTKVAVLMVEMDQGKSCGGHPKKCEGLLENVGMRRWGNVQGGDQLWYDPEYFSDARPILAYNDAYMEVLKAKAWENWRIGEVLYRSWREEKSLK